MRIWDIMHFIIYLCICKYRRLTFCSQFIFVHNKRYKIAYEILVHKIRICRVYMHVRCSGYLMHAWQLWCGFVEIPGID